MLTPVATASDPRAPRPLRTRVDRRKKHSRSPVLLWPSALAFPPLMRALLRHCQKTPAQRFILRVLLAERQRGRGFRQLVAEIEGVGRINSRAGSAELVEEFKGVGSAPVAFAVHDVE